MEWVERELGGRVVGLERLPRWRAGWLLDLEQGGAVLPLYVRGERVAGFLSPFPLEHELRVHRLLEANGIPVPHVYGLVAEGPLPALVMERVRGRQGLDLVDDPTRRRALLLDWVDLVAEIHRLDRAEIVRHGIGFPDRAEDVVVSEVFRTVEASYLARVARRDPVVELLRWWVHRNRPLDRARPAFVTWDAAQFLHHDGELTALIDFELAHVGDAHMDLATLRTRDTIEPFGELAPAFARYQDLTGQAIDMDVIRYYEVSQLTLTMMLQAPVLEDPDPETDYVTHLTWYVESGRYACDVLAELHGLELDPVDLGEGAGSRHAAPHRHLVASLRSIARGGGGAEAPGGGATPSSPAEPASDLPVAPSYEHWRHRCHYRLARHLARVQEIGEVVDREDLAETSELLGDRFEDLARADAALVAAIEAGSLDEREVLRVIDRRLQRHHAQLGPPGARVVSHPPLQPLPS